MLSFERTVGLDKNHQQDEVPHDGSVSGAGLNRFVTSDRVLTSNDGKSYNLCLGLNDFECRPKQSDRILT